MKYFVNLKDKESLLESPFIRIFKIYFDQTRNDVYKRQFQLWDNNGLEKGLNKPKNRPLLPARGQKYISPWTQ